MTGEGLRELGQACWLPIAPGLTPHGLRHTHKTLMKELGTPPKLMDERLGHEDGSVQALCSHVTPAMRKQLMAGLAAVADVPAAQRACLTVRTAEPAGAPPGWPAAAIQSRKPFNVSSSIGRHVLRQSL